MESCPIHMGETKGADSGLVSCSIPEAIFSGHDGHWLKLPVGGYTACSDFNWQVIGDPTCFNKAVLGTFMLLVLPLLLRYNTKKGPSHWFTGWTTSLSPNGACLYKSLNQIGLSVTSCFNISH